MICLVFVTGNASTVFVNLHGQTSINLFPVVLEKIILIMEEWVLYAVSVSLLDRVQMLQRVSVLVKK